MTMPFWANQRDCDSGADNAPQTASTDRRVKQEGQRQADAKVTAATRMAVSPHARKMITARLAGDAGTVNGFMEARQGDRRGRAPFAARHPETLIETRVRGDAAAAPS
jgi:hypothetical protein